MLDEALALGARGLGVNPRPAPLGSATLSQPLPPWASYFLSIKMETILMPSLPDRIGTLEIKKALGTSTAVAKPLSLSRKKKKKSKERRDGPQLLSNARRRSGSSSSWKQIELRRRQLCHLQPWIV